MTGAAQARQVAVSAMVFTLNEEIHLPACLASLAWCDDVIVVDSHSTDGTERIAREAGARFFRNTFAGFGTQRNWALEHTEPRHEWVLILDADERVPPEMVAAMAGALAAAPQEVAAYRVARRFHLWGRWLRHSNLYPTYVVRLVRRGRVRYVNRGHAETQEVEGEVRTLGADLIDENLKGIDEWFERQNRYSTREAQFELEQEGKPWKIADLWSGEPTARRALLKRMAARLPGRAAWYFLYSYVLRAGFLDGRDGLVFCTMKATYQAMIATKKHDMRRRRRAG